MTKYLFFIWMLLCTSSCVVMRESPIETLQPANTTFNKPKKKIVVYSSPLLLDEAIQKNKATNGVQADSLIRNILYSLKNFLEKSPGFEHTSFSVMLVEDHEEMFRSFDFDYFISLDHLQINNKHYMQQYTSYRWEAFAEIFYIALWSIKNHNGDTIDNYIDRDVQIWFSGTIPYVPKERSYTYAYIDPTDVNLPSVNDIWWDLGIMLAKSCAQFIAPHWQEEARGIYMINKFPELSGLAYTAMKNNGYERAINIWEEMLISCRKRGQKKRKSKITYNIAVAYEYMNQLDESVRWLQRSINYSSNKTSINTNYLRLLENRKKQSVLLDKQINSNH